MEVENLLAKIEKLEDHGAKLKKAEKYIEALKKYEKAYALRKQIQGETHEEMLAWSHEMAVICNILAMSYLQKEQFQVSLEFLRTAESVSKNDDRMSAVTYNNYAWLFRRTKKYRSALSYLEKALSIEYTILNDSEDAVEDWLAVSSPCDIHLNIWAILSQMGKHELALQHSMKALILIQDEIMGRLENSEESTRIQKVRSVQERMIVLWIAYHNIAVEQEFLKQYNPCLRSYKKAAEWAKEYLGDANPMTNNLVNAYESATKKIATEIEKTWVRKHKSSSNHVKNAEEIEEMLLSSNM